MINARLDTVTQSLMFAFETLLENPHVRAELVTDPSKIPAFVEETLRLNPVALFPPRVVAQDTQIDAVSVPAGTRVSACLGAANRDPSTHENPDETVLGREGRHWAFGGGVHRCLGRTSLGPR
ncbi:cytochrome P450 [Janibacter terrae]|uniref:cytochrome P450 n=1 Tax=Janibacter terrae TaxID=103817 RepID=UPI000838F6D2|nr:cytochrome P450 [Janibacter terrae]